eukprot:gnl/MRDRNA2_/MRDRNA2_26098_c0_seq1.p1 gnl/MRDRNA2_/MRDRNA2_26098_c0~~gnl/MRDRNA2_/MRDRNA2_26098_c0_seq1.p1  ORF type:complete len:129 (+),score=16.59 gnl/MRDRNA2_/MRDRNA2_26098_c0_seq1:263-649(+)
MQQLHPSSAPVPTGIFQLSQVLHGGHESLELSEPFRAKHEQQPFPLLLPELSWQLVPGHQVRQVRPLELLSEGLQPFWRLLLEQDTRVLHLASLSEPMHPLPPGDGTVPHIKLILCIVKVLHITLRLP